MLGRQTVKPTRARRGLAHESALPRNPAFARQHETHTAMPRASFFSDCGTLESSRSRRLLKPQIAERKTPHNRRKKRTLRRWGRNLRRVGSEGEPSFRFSVFPIPAPIAIPPFRGKLKILSCTQVIRECPPAVLSLPQGPESLSALQLSVHSYYSEPTSSAKPPPLKQESFATKATPCRSI